MAKHKGLKTEKIIKMRKKLSIKEIASIFNVDYRTIHFHLNKSKRGFRLCECGCGKLTQAKRCIKGHSGHKWIKTRENYQIDCACGCKEKIWKYGNDHRVRKFAHGHNDSRKAKRGMFYSEKNKQYIRYQSSFELAAYSLLEQMSKVISYKRPTYVLYEFEGKVRKYYPDILIKYIDGTSEIVEVKPKGLISLPKNQAKFSAMKNDNFSIWTEDTLNAFIAKRVNSGKPKRKDVGNPEPSRVEPRKVQRLLEEDTSSLITSKSALHESDDIVQPLLKK